LTDTVATINQEMIATLVIIHRIASRALSDDERVGQPILGNPRGEINGLLVQMAAIGQLARAGLPKEGRELLELAVAKKRQRRSALRGGRPADFITGHRRSGRLTRSS
jgi:hypothetical protein